MSADNDPTINIIDNSDMDLSGSLRDPVIDKQWVKCRITNLYWEQIETKKGEKAKQLVIGLVTDESTTAEDGRPIPAGHRPPNQTIFATPTGKLDMDSIRKRLARFQIAALGLDVDPKNPVLPAGTTFGKPDQYIGRAIKAFFEAEHKPDATYQRVGRWGRA